MDLEKHIAYWRQSAQEDLEAAQVLQEIGRHRHALFFAHLAVEKMLKAHLTKKIKTVPPRIHNLIRLADLAELKISVEQDSFLRRLNAYQMVGRYPDMPSSPDEIHEEHATELLIETQGFLECLKNRL
jgi:HEPN domain-containing protein